MRTKIWMLAFIAATFVAEANPGQKEINGVVVLKDNGEVLDLVVVWVKGTNQGMVTGNDGHFDLNVNEGDTLEFSAKGFRTAELIVGKRSLYKAELESTEDNDNISHVSAFELFH